MLGNLLRKLSGQKTRNLGPYEVEFDTVTPQELHRRVLEDGCCIVRNAIPAHVVIQYRDMLEIMFRETADKVKAGENIEQHKRVHIVDPQFKEKFGEQHSFFKILDKSPKFFTFMDNLFGKGKYEPSVHDTVTRSIQGDTDRARDETSFRPSQIHMDGVYHDTWPYFAINYWIPFDNCGKGTEAPGFAVYPADYRTVRHYTGLNTKDDINNRRSESPTGQIEMESLLPMFDTMYKAEGIKMVAPRFEIGDVMLINSWTPHGTYWDGFMPKHRRNLEIRYRGDSWDPLPYESKTARQETSARIRKPEIA